MLRRLYLLPLVIIAHGPVVPGSQDRAGSAIDEPLAVPPNDVYLSAPSFPRALSGHVDQEDIERGRWTFPQLREAGRRLFVAQFTIHDGAGRPGATGDENPARRPLVNAVPFQRSAGPDANSCVSCHRSPSIGGAGDFAVNVFIGPGSREPTITSIDPRFTAERNTPAIHGAGVIELLAREMTRVLIATREETIAQARRNGAPVRTPLVAKGVSFGFVTALPDGRVEANEIEGVDTDLVVRPWGQKGNVTSLRTFTITAANLHHGMQARERFGILLTGTADHDRDQVLDELTEGDITALTVFQASLNIPGQVLPRDPEERKLVDKGELLFGQVGCAECHVPELHLDKSIYTEPGPYNLEGVLRDFEVSNIFTFDIMCDIPKPRLERDEEGRVVVRAFTDFKRHRISDLQTPHFGNEHTVQGFVPTETFITKRLWAVGNTGPFGHRGDLTTIREAILHHGGEASPSRQEFEKLHEHDQRAIEMFLETLRILPEGSPRVVLARQQEELPYRE